MKRKFLAILLACILTAALLPVGTASAMQIFITIIVDGGNGETISLEVEPTDSIEAVKAKIHERKGLDPDRQRLVYNGIILNEGKTLSDYNIKKESTIQLRYRPEAYPALPFAVVRIKPGTATGSDILVTSFDADKLSFNFSIFDNGQFLWFQNKLAYKYPDVPQSFQSTHTFLRWRVEIEGNNDASISPPGQGLPSMIEGEAVTLTALWNDDPSSCTVQSPTSITVSENAQETSFTLSLSALHLGIADCAAFHFESGDFVSGENRIHYDTEYGNRYYFSTADDKETIKLFIGEETWQNAKGGEYTANLAYTIFYQDSYHNAITEETGTIPMTLSVGHCVVVMSNNAYYGSASASIGRARQGETVTLTATAKPGYRFKAWNVLSGGVTIENNAFVMGESDVSIEAVFEPVGSVKFRNWDGTELQSESVAYGETPVYRGETPQKPSDDPHIRYHFIDWDPPIHAVDAVDTVYTAQFEAESVYVVTYRADWDGAVLDTVQVSQNGSYKLPYCPYAPPAGKAFKCWEVRRSDGLITQRFANTEFTVTEDCTVRPVWEDTRIVTQAYPADWGTAVYDVSTSTFTATPNTGYVFAGWKYVDESGMSPDDFTSTDNPYQPARVDNGTYTAYFKDAPVSAPTFKAISAVLSGTIGLQFDLALPENYSAEPMMFVVGDTEKQTADGVKRDTGRYRYTFYFNSIEMAVEGKAVYTYMDAGDIRYVSTAPTSVYAYLCTFADYTGDDAAYLKAKPLARALIDYGWYAQRYLDSIKGWTLDVDYPAVPKKYRESYDFEEIRAATEKFAIDKGAYAENGIAEITQSLTLDSATAINLYVRMPEGYDGDVTAKQGSTTLTPERTSDGRWRITIPNISAHNLGKEYNVKITTEKDGGDVTTTVEVSAMSYVYSCMVHSNNTLQKNAAAALYAYYQAASEYRN
jgi:hypothetical protein